MPILTNKEARILLQNNNVDYQLLNMLIPIVENAIVGICNNEFIDTYQSLNGIMPTCYTYSNTIYFQKSDNSINDDTNDFTQTSFKSGDIIRVYNSINNDKMFTISSLAAHKIIIDSDYYTINNEDVGNTIVFARVSFPDEFKLIATQMLKFNLQKHGVLFKSEKIDDYSYIRDVNLANGYPADIVAGLYDRRSVYRKTIPYNTLYYRQV